MKSAVFMVILMVVLSQDICLALRLTRQASSEPTQIDPAEEPCTTTEVSPGVCTPISRCTTFLDDLSLGRCALDGDPNAGICCPTTAPVVDDSGVNFGIPVLTARFQGAPAPIVASTNDINSAGEFGEEELRKRDELERRLLQLGIFAQPGTPVANHQFIQFTEQSSLNAARDGFVVREAAANIAVKFNIPASQAPGSLSSVPNSNTNMQKACPVDPECPATKYRSIDGSCNNLINRNWGKSQRAFNRLMHPKYSDGVGKPRVASDGSQLPSTRLISVSVLNDLNRELPDISLLLMTWGQFLDHDLVQTPLQRGANNTGLVCCSPQVIADPTLLHPECLPIAVPPTDRVYSKIPGTKSQCMEFVRALDAKPNDCSLSHREQQNQMTAYIDGSQVYGPVGTTAQNLREKSGGRLKAVKLANGRERPPTRTAAGGCQSRPTSHQFCFDAGDTRSSEQPQLATLQLIWLREHNRIAEELAKMHPGWNDEILYQESRRIVGAMLQHITYNEFLRIVLGRKIMHKFNINLTPLGFTNDYDPKVDATILNEFATAAYRFGHSIIPGMFQLGQRRGSSQALRDHFLQPYDTNLVDSYILGSASQGSQKADNFVTADVTTMLFRNATANDAIGLDLPAINMQRGRDHGIPGYNEVREFCQLKKASSFAELGELFINPDVANTFSNIYKNVDDVDLWVGGVSEKHAPGAVVGETFACIIAEQFKRLKIGDRLWYERANTESSFSEAQLDEIRKTTLARVFCDNSDVKQIQPLVFYKPAEWNSPTDCNSKSIPKMSLQLWKNEPVWT